MFSLPLIESAFNDNNYDSNKINRNSIDRALVHANESEKYRGEFSSMEKSRYFSQIALIAF